MNNSESEAVTSSSPELWLWRAVIWQAIQDLRGESLIDQAEARQFFTARTGEWAAWRRQVCDMADIDPDRLMKRLETAAQTRTLGDVLARLRAQMPAHLLA